MNRFDAIVDVLMVVLFVAVISIAIFLASVAYGVRYVF